MIDTANQSSTVTVVAKRTDGSIQHYTFDSDGGVFVGRSTNCGLRLQGEGLSDIHCRIELEDGDAWVQDWMSKQGTMVDGTMIDTKQLLEPGAILNVGEYSITIRSGDATKVVAEAAASSTALPDSSEQTESPSMHMPPASGGSQPSPTAAASKDLAAPAAQARTTDIPVENASHHDTIQQHMVGHETVDEDTINQLSAGRDGFDHADFDHDEEPADADAGATRPVASASFDFDADFFEEETYDRETVELLRAEIIDLQAALSDRDAEDRASLVQPLSVSDTNSQTDQSDALLARMQELLDEAQRSDERVALLEEMLHASEEASRSEQEERSQLEGWVGEIEKRIGQREDEHAAEVDALKRRAAEAIAQRDDMQQKLHRTATQGAAPQQYEETLEALQQQNRMLQQQLDESVKQLAVLNKQLANSQQQQDEALREERAEIAQERAKISRLRFELSNRLSGIEELPKNENEADRETALRLQTLRQHLREIHEEEKREAKQASLATRVKKLWNRVEY